LLQKEKKDRKKLIKIITSLALEGGNTQSSKVAKTPGVRKEDKRLDTTGVYSKLIEKHSDMLIFFIGNALCSRSMIQ